MSGNSLWSWVLALNLMLCLLYLVHTQQCHHKPAQISPNNRVHLDRPQTQPRILSPDRRMKFHVEYHLSVLESNRSKEIQSVVAEVVDRVSRTLSVKQEPGNFLFGTNCEKPRQTVTINGREYCTVRGCYYAYCGEIMAPEGLSEPCFDCNDDGENCTKSGGPSADREPVHYTLFVASLTASCQENFIAYSYACRIDDRTDRPVAGVINICPIGLELSRGRLLDTLQHEMFHALGFSSSMYGLYRDANGRPLTPREANGLPAYNQKTFEFVWSDRVIQNFTLDWDYINGTTKRSIQAFVTPNVLREARAHFGCPSLMGVELEDGGGYGTAMSHFEKRILATESMNGFLTPVRVFSRISLALMEDTGWYIPDYDMADNLNWGKGLGCDFVQKSCKNWIDTRIASGMSPAPWCTKRFETGCHAEGTDVAFCNLNKYDSPISEIYQVFTEINGVDSTELSRIGGNRLADFCPFFEADYRLAWNQSASDLYCTNLEIIDDCRNNECMNGGVCRDVINGYYCDCPVGYAGGFCEHVNVECRLNSECHVNEVCTANQCVCQRDRIRDENLACIGVTDVKEYSMTLTVIEVNGVPAVYHPSLTGHAGEGFRHGIEYEVRQILRDDPTLRSNLLDVVTRNISSGSIIVDLALMFRQNLSDSSSDITLASVAAAMATMQDNVLQKSGTIFMVAMNATVVKDANECEDSAGNDCSPNAQCTNTEGNYECSCYPGYEDTGREGVLPGRNCTDINECLTTLAKDCSPHADCLNMNGSYSCICWEGYDDKSLDAGRPGRVCDKHVHRFPVGVTIALSVGLGCVVFLAVVLIFIWCNFTRKKASPPQKGSSETRAPHHLPHYHARDVVKNVKKIDYDVELLFDVDNIRHQRHHPHRERDAPYQHLKRKEPHLFHELNGPRPYHKREEPRPHYKPAEFHPHHKREEPRLFHDPDGPRPLPGAIMVGDLNRSRYYGEDRSHMDSPFVSTGPAVSTVISSNRQLYNMNI